MKLSIIIPMYNVEKYAKQCLESVINRKYSDLYEVIVINDKSTDKTVKIIKKFNEIKNIHLINNEKNLGLASTRNKGLSKAKGEYIIFLDGDDILSEKFWNWFFNKELNQDIYIFGYKRFIDDVDDKGVVYKPKIEYEIYKDYLFIAPGMTCKVFLKEYINKFPQKKVNYEDYNIWPQVSQTKKIELVDKEFYFYRINPDSISQQNDEHRFEEMKKSTHEIDFTNLDEDKMKFYVYKHMFIHQIGRIEKKREQYKEKFGKLYYELFKSNYIDDMNSNIYNLKYNNAKLNRILKRKEIIIKNKTIENKKLEKKIKKIEARKFYKIMRKILK